MALESYVENNGPFAKRYWGTAAPSLSTDGTYAVGDEVVNTVPSSGNDPGWLCTTAGTPGTWKARADLA